MTRSDVFDNGKFTPFRFFNFKAKRVQACFDGTPKPSTELSLVDFTLDRPTPRWDALRAMSWYLRLMEIAGGGDTPCGLTFDQYTTNTTIFGIDMDNTALSRNTVSPIEVGALDLSIEFDRPLDLNVYVYALGIFRDTIAIEPKQKLLTMSYSPQQFG